MFAEWFMIVFIGVLALGIVAQVIAGIREKRAEKLAEDIEDIEPGDKVLIKKKFTFEDTKPYGITDWMESVRGKVVTVLIDVPGNKGYFECEGMTFGSDVVTKGMIAKVIKAGGRK